MAPPRIEIRSDMLKWIAVSTVFTYHAVVLQLRYDCVISGTVLEPILSETPFNRLTRNSFQCFSLHPDDKQVAKALL